jgi:hypothetical protein
MALNRLQPLSSHACVVYYHIHSKLEHVICFNQSNIIKCDTSRVSDRTATLTVYSLKTLTHVRKPGLNCWGYET